MAPACASRGIAGVIEPKLRRKKKMVSLPGHLRHCCQPRINKESAIPSHAPSVLKRCRESIYSIVVSRVFLVRWWSMHPLFRFTLEMDAPNPDPAMERAVLSLADSEATFRRGETNLELKVGYVDGLLWCQRQHTTALEAQIVPIALLRRDPNADPAQEVFRWSRTWPGRRCSWTRRCAMAQRTFTTIGWRYSRTRVATNSGMIFLDNNFVACAQLDPDMPCTYIDMLSCGMTSCGPKSQDAVWLRAN